MKFFSKFVLLLVVAGMLFTFAACSSSSGGDDEDQYRLTIHPTEGGTVTVDPAGTVFNAGTTITLTPVPDPGKRFTGWSGTFASTQNPLVLTMNKDYSLFADFDDACSFSVAPVTAGTGTFTVNGDAPESGYESGTTLVLAAVPAAGYEFIQWQGDLTGTDNPATFTIREEKNIKALFGPTGVPKHELTVTVSPANSTGEVNLVSGQYAEGTIFELVATPASGYRFVSYSCGTWSASTETASFTMPSSDAELEVAFAENETNREFRAQKATDGTWYTVTADLLGEGTYCNVFVEQGSGVTQTQAEAVAAEYDANIHQKITNAFGAHRDVDGNDKVTLLLLDIVDGYDPDVGGGFVAGYFDPAHMDPKTDNSNSNECDMIFIDVNPVEPGSEEFFTTIAHEFQHLINYSRTYMVNGRAQDIWINEGLSSGAEYIYSGAVSQERVDWFNSTLSYQNGGPAIVYGNNFFVWYGYWEDNYPNTVLDNYATVNLFFQWLRIHASNKTAIYKEILDSTYRDYRTVTTAASNRIGSDYSSWARLLETWYLANFCRLGSDVYGYEGLINTNPVYFSNSDDQEWSLSPGEAIISALSATAGSTATWTPPTGSGANIKYTGFDSDGTDVNRTPSFTNQYAIVYNANTSNTASDEKGFVANVVAAPGDNSVARSIQARIDANKKELPKKFAVGFHPGYGGAGETPEQRLLKNKAGFAPAATIQGKKDWR